MPYIVYKHTCLKNSKVYIGMTGRTLEERAGSNGNGYKAHNPHFWSAIQKYGWKDGFKHEVLYIFETIEEAEQKEIELIAKYNATDRRYGYNVLIGGNCTQHPSEETRRKIAEKQRGRKMPDHVKEILRQANLGREIYDETRRRMSESAKKREHFPLTEATKRKISEANRGRKYSEEYRQIMSERAEKMPVEQFDKQGNFIQEFKSITEASKILKISKSHISDCCKNNPLYRTAGGYQWRFKGDDKVIGVVLPPQKAPKQVIQKTSEGEIMRIYASAAEASRVTGLDASSIRKCVQGKLHHCGGYIWENYNSLN